MLVLSSVDLTKPGAFWCRWSWRLGESLTDNIFMHGLFLIMALCGSEHCWFFRGQGTWDYRVLLCKINKIEEKTGWIKWVCQVLRCSDHLSHTLMGSVQTISREQFPLESSAEEGLNFTKEWLRLVCMEKTSQVLCEHDFCAVHPAEVGGWGLALPWRAGISASCSVTCPSAAGKLHGDLCQMSKCRLFHFVWAAPNLSRFSLKCHFMESIPTILFLSK